MPPRKSAKVPAKKATAKTSASRKAAPKKAVARKASAKTAAKKAPARKAAASSKGAAKKTAPKKAAAKKAGKKVSFGRPGTAGKAEGDDAVRAWIASVKPEHRALVERLDALVGEAVPDVKRALKWSMPMYGREGIGWFANVGAFKEHVRLSFFAGTDLTPPPPEGESKTMRGVNLRDASDFDEKRFRSWIQQAASMPGWGKV